MTYNGMLYNCINNETLVCVTLLLHIFKGCFCILYEGNHFWLIYNIIKIIAPINNIDNISN